MLEEKKKYLFIYNCCEQETFLQRYKNAMRVGYCPSLETDNIAGNCVMIASSQ